jgi:drug/metabolite transporter (DMT)-like permease
VTPLSRPTVVAGLLVGILAVSTSAILARFAMGDAPGVLTAAPGAAPALAVAFWRTLGGALALAPFAVRHHLRGRHTVTRRHHRLLVVSGLALGLHFALFQGALALTTVASATTLATMSPVFVALGAWWLLGEPTVRRTWFGMGLTLIGAVVIGVADARGGGHAPAALAGDVMALGSALAVTGYLLVGRAVRREVGAVTYSAIVYAWAAAGLWVACRVTGVALTGFDTTTWLLLAGIVIGPQLLGHTVFNTLLSTVSATVVSIAVLAEPVGAGLLAWLLLGELPVPWFFAGAPLVVAGVAMAVVRPARPARAAAHRGPGAGRRSSPGA